ncbi:hypothetical protein [Thalassobacillus sp. CUG 92003]|uniref:hypothetical protein n=1 Tax=Thalassobacillus sp. CUG 92003 TaxID=2736641 RepID=UPI0015E7E2E8|nr:hypothetical protein [Thalassobacillus sp. CUG 92003]
MTGKKNNSEQPVKKENKKNNFRKIEKDSSIEEKLRKEQMMEDIPLEDIRQEEIEQEKGEKSKDNSSTEEDYDEDFK